MRKLLPAFPHFISTVGYACTLVAITGVKLEKNMITDEEKIKHSKIMLETIPFEGIGNVSLKQKLGLGEDEFWDIRQILLDQGTIATGRGKGGSVYRLKQETKVSDSKNKDSDRDREEYKKEKHLYAPFQEYLEKRFFKELGLKSSIIYYKAVDISSQGKRDTGGIWTRPDLLIISINKYPFFIQKTMEVITFELKTFDNFDITSVYETLAHTKFATKSFLAVHIPPGEVDSGKGKKLDRIEGECKRFGVGLIYFSDPKDLEAYEIAIESNRNSPDPYEIDNFIKSQVPEEIRNDYLRFV